MYNTPAKQTSAKITVLAFCIALGLLLSCVSAPALAASNHGLLNTSAQGQKWLLNAEKMVVLAGGDILEATGAVELRQGKDYMKADFVRFYNSTRWVFLKGNVEIRTSGDTINASEAEFDIDAKTGWMKNGHIFAAGPHTYFSGETITKHWGDKYSFKNAKITACDGDSPAWSVAADSAVLEIDGYAQLWGTSFQVKDLPIVYSPYLIMPAKRERQTGLLQPEFGTSSFRGTYYTQPFFWAIDQSRDLTVTETFMSKRGFMHGLNYRSRTAEDDQLWLRVDWLYDKKVVHKDGDGNDDYVDGLVRNNHERYWVRGMYDANLPGDSLWKFRADVDLVSDQYLLRDFETMYNESRDTLYNDFSRDLNSVTDPRVTQGMLFREWERASLYLSGAYTQQPYYGNGNLSNKHDYTVQRLPEVDAYLHRFRLFEDIPLELDASGQYAYMYRRTGTTGSRFDFRPRLTLPLVSDYGSVVFSGELFSTFYASDSKNFSSAAYERTGMREDGTHRFLPSYSVVASTELSRAFEFASVDAPAAGESTWTGLKHNIVPRLAFYRTPERDQRENPHYDAYDRIDEREALVYSLENTLTRRRESTVARKAADGSDELYTSTDYLDVLRFRLSQSYDLVEADRKKELDTYKRRPFGDIIAEMNVALDSRLSVNAKAAWSPYEGRFTTQDYGVTLYAPSIGGRFYGGVNRRDRIHEYYRERNNTLTVVKVNGDINLMGPFSLYFFYDWSVSGNAEETKGLYLTYNHQCFTLGLTATQDEKDTSFGFRFTLQGF